MLKYKIILIILFMCVKYSEAKYNSHKYQVSIFKLNSNEFASKFDTLVIDSFFRRINENQIEFKSIICELYINDTELKNYQLIAKRQLSLLLLLKNRYKVSSENIHFIFIFDALTSMEQNSMVEYLIE